MTDTKRSILNNRYYDVLKYIAQIVLPAIATLYFALSKIWGLPWGEEVIGSITAVDIFLGVILGISSKTYNQSDAKYDGIMEVENVGDDTKRFSLNLKSDPDDLDKKHEVVFKVHNEGPRHLAISDPPKPVFNVHEEVPPKIEE